MKIYSMTATFGKLEHETLTLQPGLNVIEAPNEWGKSTWCAFLVSMLYGIETRIRSTSSALADKERYAPWSGAPMSGSIDLNWNGRDITIERRSKGRVVFGEFKAYETATGLPVPELNGANCGSMLLGVEKSVFLRSGFIRLTDMPVTQDEALRRRLNSLVTTGDESGEADLLAKKLKDLKNRCRYNRSGLLPQAETELAYARQKLMELDYLESQSLKLKARQTQLEDAQVKLENHRKALDYAKALEDRQHIARAQEEAARAAKALQEQEQACEGLISKSQALQSLHALDELLVQRRELELQLQMLPQPPQEPVPPAPFEHMTLEEVKVQVTQDTAAYEKLTRQKPLLWLLPAGILLAAGIAIAALLPVFAVAGWIALAGSVVPGILALVLWQRKRKALDAYHHRYGSDNPAFWQKTLEIYENQVQAHLLAVEELRRSQENLDSQLTAVRQGIDSLCASQSQDACREQWQQAICKWDALESAKQEHQRLSALARTLLSMAKDIPDPAGPDTLTLSSGETNRMLTEAAVELRQLQMKLGQCQGQMEAIGHRAALESRCNALAQRVQQLEDTYAALALAQDALEKAAAELQRRFAPQISKRAQDLFSRMTGGRYDRLILGQDLSLEAVAADEDTLCSALWRSDGTVDQLYLALRLAVAGELTPNAPLVLDDALVRFDDKRMAAAMEVLKEESASRQVILFTCQGREKAVM